MRKLLFVIAVLTMTGCKILDPSIMLRTEKDYAFDQIPDTLSEQYRLAPNDIIRFRLFSNDGFKLIDVISQQSSGNQSSILQFSPTYQIEFDGFVKLPILGRTKISGLTLREAEFFLEEKYSEYYNNPYAILQVTNRRVIIFPGQSGQATVINLQNDNTTLLEALALVGGLGNDAQAHKIKIIREEDGERKIFQIDLSTIDGINEGSMVIQANDIIYVEPRVKVVREVLNEITPVIQLVNTTVSLLTTYFLIQNLTKGD